jgi:hypothetical protein
VKERLLFFLVMLLFLPGRPAAAMESALNQKDWMVQLVEVLGWSYGLPDEPQDIDYQHILEGRRRFRIEAEAHFHPDDEISVQQFQSFGAFSGQGWLSGIAAPTVAHLHFNLPLGGDFTVTAALRLAGHRIQIGGQTIEVNGEANFGRQLLGTFTLPAGAHEVELHLPPNSAFDYLEFAAPDLSPVQPVAGWQPAEPLTLAVMAETTAQILNLNHLLPPAGEPIAIEAETISAFPTGAGIIQASHLGEPSGGAWVRAGALPAVLRLSFSRPQAGVCALQMRAAAETPVTVTVNDSLSLQGVSPPYLETTPLGNFILPAGENMVDFRLPSRGGLDSFLLIPCGGPDDFLRLAGLTGNSDPPAPALVEKYLALLAAIGGSR